MRSQTTGKTLQDLYEKQGSISNHTISYSTPEVLLTISEDINDLLWMCCSVFKYMPCDFECWLRRTYISALCSVYTAMTWFHPSCGVYVGAGVSFAKGKQQEVLLIEMGCFMIRSGEGLALTVHVISDLFSVWRRYLISPLFFSRIHT